MPLDNPPPPGVILTIAETEVFSGNAPAAWTALDLSAVIGANAAIVLLKVYTAAGANTYAFRKKTDTDEFYAATQADAGGCVIVRTENAIHYVVIVAAHTDGIIEWRALLANATTVDIIAFIK